MIEDIRAMARNLSIRWDNQFDVDELVNEAWMRSLKDNISDTPLIMRRAKFDIIDYIRQEVGKEQVKENGKIKYKTRKRNRFVTNIDSSISNRLTHHFFDREYDDPNLLTLENNEIITLVLSEQNEKHKKLIKEYFLNEKTFSQIAEETHTTKGYVCQLVHSGIKKCNEQIKTMEIECVKI